MGFGVAKQMLLLELAQARLGKADVLVGRGGGGEGGRRCGESRGCGVGGKGGSTGLVALQGLGQGFCWGGSHLLVSHLHGDGLLLAS